MAQAHFEWDNNKEKINQEKHGIPFSIARLVFLDPKRLIAKDLKHSKKREAILLYRQSRFRHNYCSICISQRDHKNNRRRILAKRKGAL